MTSRSGVVAMSNEALSHGYDKDEIQNRKENEWVHDAQIGLVAAIRWLRKSGQLFTIKEES